MGTVWNRHVLGAAASLTAQACPLWAKLDKSTALRLNCHMSSTSLTKETILVVDDEPNIVELARLYLEADGYRVISAGDGQEALVLVETNRPALVVLDLMLPQLDGWEVCRRIRAASNLPIIMLTARTDDVDKIVGLELGADDYLTKPFNPRELVARVRAVLRRAAPSAPTDRPLALAQLAIDPAAREVTISGQPVHLRGQEFDLLHTLAQHRGIVLSRQQLLDQAWGYDYYGDTRTVDVHVGQVRRKIEGSGVRIETVRGIGYKLVA
jgi:DNA-binding response OmpR family regulator